MRGGWECTARAKCDIYDYLVTSTAGAVAKYCEEYVCLCVCLSARNRMSPEPHTRDLYQIFVHVAVCPWLGPPPAC